MYRLDLAGFWNGSGWVFFNSSNSNLPGGNVWSATSGPDGSMWFGTVGVFSRYRYYDFLNYSTPLVNNVTALAFDSLGLLCCATSDVSTNNVYTFDLTKWQTYSYTNSPIPNEGIRGIVADSHGSVMIGTGAGLVIRTSESLTSDLGESSSQPLKANLRQNYPNPFNPTTSINFSVERNARASLRVYDILGRHVTALFDGIAEAGQMYRLRFEGKGLASGVYCYVLQLEGRRDVRRMILLR